MPRPRSLPRVRASARRFSKPAWSASASARSMLAREVAAVVGEDEPGLERHRGGRDQVAAAQLDGIDAELARGDVDHALDRERRLGPAGAAVGAGGRGVGEHAGASDGGWRASCTRRPRRRRCWCRAPRCAGVRYAPTLRLIATRSARNLPSRSRASSAVGDVVAAVLVGDESFAPVRRPLHRPAQPAARPTAPGPSRGRSRCACRSCRRPRR